MLDNSKKIVINGKNVDTTMYKKGIQELLSMEEKRGFDIHEKSIMHYAMEKDSEWVLIKWQKSFGI